VLVRVVLGVSLVLVYVGVGLLSLPWALIVAGVSGVVGALYYPTGGDE